MKLRRALLGERVTVESFEGSGAYGSSYQGPVVVACAVNASRSLTRDADGKEVVAAVRLFCQPEQRDAAGEPVQAAVLFAPESRVTYLGRQYVVDSSVPHTFRGKAVHVEVVLS